MTRSRPAPPASKRRRVSKTDGDVFPLLSLPDKALTNVFSWLLIKDRMNARVCKKLNEIELESPYFVKSLTIGEMTGKELALCKAKDSLDDQHIFLISNKRYSSDWFHRMACTASIGHLKIKLPDWKILNCQIFKKITEYDLDRLDIEMESSNAPNNSPVMVMRDAYFLELTRSSKAINMTGCDADKVTASAIHQVYKEMVAGSTNLCELEMKITAICRRKFLNLIEITFEDGDNIQDTDIKLTSKRAIEAYQLKKPEVGNPFCKVQQLVHIFDGSLEIIIVRGRSIFHLKKHQTQKSLEKAKKVKKFKKMDLIP